MAKPYRPSRLISPQRRGLALERVSTETDPVTRADPATRGTGVVILSQLLLRISSAAGALVIGAYFVRLRSDGVAVDSLTLGLLSGLTYLAELVFAPLAGAISDRRGRRLFLIAAPLLAAVGTLLTPTASVFAAVPALLMIIVVVGAARLIEGAGAAGAAPATLGLLADSTDDDRIRRGRRMSLYELASTGGIAVGAVIGPLLWSGLGLGAFAVLAGLYLVASALTAAFVREPGSSKRSGRNSPPASSILRRALSILSDRRLVAFVPAWIAVNAVLGTWVTAQITFVLAGEQRMAGQRFVGSLAGRESTLSLVLGGYVLVFSLCVVGWVFLAGRFPVQPMLFVTVAGTIVASVGLIAGNHGVSAWVFVPVVVVGVFLEAGFTPAALIHLADLSAVWPADRGLVLGVYSVILALGYLAGNVLGGVFARWLAFDGLAVLTIGLAVVAMVSVAVSIVVERRSGLRSASGTA